MDFVEICSNVCTRKEIIKIAETMCSLILIKFDVVIVTSILVSLFGTQCSIIIIIIIIRPCHSH